MDAWWEAAWKALGEVIVKDDFEEVFKWSQGGFGPAVYTGKFLTTYANAMVSESLYTQPAHRYAETFVGARRPLECGVFYIDPGVGYPLHYHGELECYYILAGTTRFVWLQDGNLVYLDRAAGEWHFNPPNMPHAITTPNGQPHLSLWFREGGPGQEANHKFGPKWIGDVDGLDFSGEDDEDDIPDGKYKENESFVGSLGFKKGHVFRDDCKHFLRLLTPTEFEYVNNNEEVMTNMDNLLQSTKKDELSRQVNVLKAQSQKVAKRRWNKLKALARLDDGAFDVPKQDTRRNQDRRE